MYKSATPEKSAQANRDAMHTLAWLPKLSGQVKKNYVLKRMSR